MAVRPVTVSDLNRYIKNVLLGDPVLSNVVVTGEISSWKRNANSGAVFFTIKDENSQIDCVMWKDAAARLTMPHDVGDLVNIHGRVDYWNNRGQLRFNAFFVEPAGEGELNAKYEKLKEELTREGLFAPERKKLLPVFPKHIFLVTSPEGSAVEDMKKTIVERNDFVDVTIYPVKVQGQGAAEDIAAAIDHINKINKAIMSEENPTGSMKPVDLMIVGRGGGSPEERWAFNEEVVVRAISASEIPVVTGIGHEDNESLSDLAADYYAKTPTAAAIAAVPDTIEIREDLIYMIESIDRSFSRYIDVISERVEFMDPGRLTGRLRYRVENSLENIENKKTLMNSLVLGIINDRAARLNTEKEKITALSPRNIMNRGYSVATDGKGKVIKSIDQVSVNDEVNINVADGTIKGTVDEVRGEEK